MIGVDADALRATTLERLDRLHERVVEVVRCATADDPNPGDPLRGLYLTPESARRIAGSDRSATMAPEDLGDLGAPLAAWADRVGLDRVDLDFLLVAMAPDLDQRYEQLFGYLHDDVTRRRASTGLALRLVGLDVTDARARRRFDESAALLRLGLLRLEDVERPFLSRALRVPDRVTAALLGVDDPPSMVTVHVAPVLRNRWVGALASALCGGARFVHVHDGRDRTAAALAASATVEYCGRAVVTELPAPPSPTDRLWVAGREAALQGGGLVVAGFDDGAAVDRTTVDRLVGLAAEGRPIVLVGLAPWDPMWSSATPLSLDAPPLDECERDELWRVALGPSADLIDARDATAAFRLGPERIERAAAGAKLQALHRAQPLGVDDLRAGARRQNTSGLRRLARRIDPEATWHDLVLEDETLGELREISTRVRFRSNVLDGWGLRRGGGRGDGITALFAGSSGTGKTLAAEVIAHDLGLDLHTVDLATVVDKYIGETEKNLDRIFDEAERANTVLFFDEADAIFGKRSEVRDARDRYANVEVAYLLQRMERFDGLVVLATNLKVNIDDAFSRRLDVTVDFPKPDRVQRRRLWTRLMGDDLPLADDVDVEFLADAFELSGGAIRNAVVAAAYRAAATGREVGMVDLVTGVASEYRKLGRLCLPAEFGAWHGVVAPSGVEAVGSAAS